ncbi:MAG: inositol monophosphatase [Bacteroidia bacterium]|nr:inositol monophosphatase [Bacteroidia bacterium]
MIDYKNVCSLTVEVAKKAGAFIRNERAWFKTTAVEYKGLNDLVSYVDKTAEDLIIASLKKILPESGFIAEEGTEAASNQHLQWIIDPLDGTTNFVHGIPCFCVSIALQAGNEIVVGVVYEINLDECFYTFKDAPSFLNGIEIKVSDTVLMQQSLIATGFPYTKFERKSAYMEVFEVCMHQTHGLRRLGSAAADLAYVACGRFEAFYEYGLKPWDVAAGVLLVKNAGGLVSDFKGGDNVIFGNDIIASNAGIHQEFLQIVISKFNGA